MKPKLPASVQAAIAYADRTAGWNNRRADVRRFELANIYGRNPCVLYVVPARRWARRLPDMGTDGQRHGGNVA